MGLEHVYVCDVMRLFVSSDARYSMMYYIEHGDMGEILRYADVMENYAECEIESIAPLDACTIRIRLV